MFRRLKVRHTCPFEHEGLMVGMLGVAFNMCVSTLCSKSFLIGMCSSKISQGRLFALSHTPLSCRCVLKGKTGWSVSRGSWVRRASAREFRRLGRILGASDDCTKKKKKNSRYT